MRVGGGVVLLRRDAGAECCECQALVDYATCCSDVLHRAEGTVKRHKYRQEDTTENK